MPVDIIIYAIVALGLALWLRSLLGMRQDGERQRPNPFLEQDHPVAKTVGTAPPVMGQNRSLGPDGKVDMLSGLGRTMAIAPEARAQLQSLLQIDRAFDAAHFLAGAQDAFVMIVEAFAQGDRATLRNLLHDSVYNAFCVALDERGRNGETASVEIHAIRRAEIIKAVLNGNTAMITVRFTADETNVLKTKEGAIVHGNPDRISETIDVWAFLRDMTAREPGWTICETRDADADAAQKPVPDSV